MLGFDAKLGLHTFPYTINKYQPATERHEATSQALTYAKARQAKEANFIVLQNLDTRLETRS